MSGPVGRGANLGIAAAALTDVLAASVDDGLAPGVVAGTTDATGLTYLGAAGRMRAAPETPMTETAIFRIASMTKLVTSVAVMMLVEEGKLDLEAPLGDFLDGYRPPEVLVKFDPATRRYETRPPAAPATIRQYLSHTAGLGYWWVDPELLALVEGEPELMNPQFAMADPGVRFGYSTSTDVLGQVIEPLSGLGLGTFFERRIFAPLGMHDTGFALPADRRRLVSLARRAANGSLIEVPLETSGNPERGGGGLYSTAADYLALLRMLLNGGTAGERRLLDAASVHEIGRNQIGDLFARPQRTALPERSNDFIFMDGSQKFGFGVMVETRDRVEGRPADSFGWGGIVNTYFWVDPRHSLAAVVLMQMAPFADPGCVALCRRFEAAVYGSETRPGAASPTQPNDPHGFLPTPGVGRASKKR